MNQISGMISRFDRTCASERHGEQKVEWRPKLVVTVGRDPGFRACFWARTRLVKVLVIRVMVKIVQDERRTLLGEI